MDVDNESPACGAPGVRGKSVSGGVLHTLASKKVFIFDFDGVLVDSLADIAASVNAVLADSGFPELPEDTLRGFVGDGARNLIVRAFSAAARAEKTKTAPLSDDYITDRLAWYTAYYGGHAVVRSSLFPGVMEVLRALRDGGRSAAVVSNKPVAITRRIADRLGIAAYLKAVVGPETTGTVKPAPDGLRAALDEINRTGSPTPGMAYTAADVVMTGDSPQDVYAGKNFGCATCAVLRGYTPEEKLRAACPDVCVDYAGDLAQLFA